MSDTQLARVENKRPTFITLPDVVEDVSTAKEPNRFREIYPGKRLDPVSAHDVDPDYIRAIEDHPTYKMYVECGYIAVTMPDDEGYDRAMERPEGPTAPPNLSEFPEEMAMALIKAEDSKPVLRQWLAAEPKGAQARKAVTGALKEKLG